MKTPAVRHVILLRLTMLGVEPAIWRDFAVDRSVTLGELHTVIQLSLGWEGTAPHLFSDSDPAVAHPDTTIRDEPQWMDEDLNHESPGWGPGAAWHDRRGGRNYTERWSGNRRRWGNHWTMIECRDPEVADESTAIVGRVFEGARPIFYSYDPSARWWFRVDAHGDDLVAGTAPRVRVVDGARRSPLEEFGGARKHMTVVKILSDRNHEAHDALLRRLARAVGPWADFAVESFDPVDTQREIDQWLECGSSHLSVSIPVIDRVLDRLPAPCRLGLRRHLDAAGIAMPPVVTREEADDATKGFRWLVDAAGEAGYELVDGDVDPSVMQAGAEHLGWTDERMTQLFHAARRMGFVYARSGRLRASKSSIAAYSDPIDLWRLSARQLLGRRIPGTSSDANALFLLALVDGSLDDPNAGLARVARALESLEERDYGPWWSYGGYFPSDEEDPAGWCLESLLLRGRSERAGGRSGAVRTLAELATGVRTKVDAFVRILMPFGLEDDGSGGWIVPAGMRELAREALLGAKWRSH